MTSRTRIRPSNQCTKIFTGLFAKGAKGPKDKPFGEYLEHKRVVIPREKSNGSMDVGVNSDGDTRHCG